MDFKEVIVVEDLVKRNLEVFRKADTGIGIGQAV